MIDKYRVLFSSKEERKIAFLLVGILMMAVLEVVSIASILPFMAVVSTPEVIQQDAYLSFAYHFLTLPVTISFLLGCAPLELYQSEVEN